MSIFLLTLVSSFEPTIKKCSLRFKDVSNAQFAEKLAYEAIFPISSFLFLIEVQNYDEQKIFEISEEIIFEGTKQILSKKIGKVREESEETDEVECVCNKCDNGNKETENGETLGDHVEHVLNCGCSEEKVMKNENKDKIIDDKDKKKNEYKNVHDETENKSKNEYEEKKNNYANVQDKNNFENEQDNKEENLNEEEIYENKSKNVQDENKSKNVQYKSKLQNQQDVIRNEKYDKNKEKKEKNNNKEKSEKNNKNREKNEEVNPKQKLSTKSEILDLLTVYKNFSLSLDINNKRLKKALEKRNSMFENDKSQIAKELCVKSLQVLSNEILKEKNDDLTRIINIKKTNKTNRKYLRMIKALRKAVIDTENLTKAIEREKSEFTRNFMVKREILESKELHEMKISFNLGGPIFVPNILLQMIQGIVILDKDETFGKFVDKLLKPIEALQNYSKMKSSTEKKEEIIKFLLACLEKRNTVFFESIDDAFKTRSSIISIYFKNEQNHLVEQKISQIDKYQEIHIKNILRIVKEASEDLFEKFLVYNEDVKKAYKKFLLTGSKEAKNNLVDLFKT
ncbi:hypothetical protein GVAV_002113 [Gurleya vavrai]